MSCIDSAVYGEQGEKQLCQEKEEASVIGLRLLLFLYLSNDWIWVETNQERRLEWKLISGNHCSHKTEFFRDTKPPEHQKHLLFYKDVLMVPINLFTEW